MQGLTSNADATVLPRADLKTSSTHQSTKLSPDGLKFTGEKDVFCVP